MSARGLLLKRRRPCAGAAVKATVSRSWHRYLVYASLVFVGIVLYRFDYLHVPSIASYGLLAATSAPAAGGVPVPGGELERPAGEERLVRFALGEGLAALGLSVLGNYVPGKVWLIVGRAGYVSSRHGYPLAKVSVLSLHGQLVSLWSGLLLGSLGAFAVGGARIWGPLILLLWLGLTLTIFSPGCARPRGPCGRQDPRTPPLDTASLPAVDGARGRLGVARLALLVRRLLPVPAVPGTRRCVSRPTVSPFPWRRRSACWRSSRLGGLGAREGVLVAYLVLAGHSAADATTVAVAARLWFLAGELALFVHRMDHRSAHRRAGGPGSQANELTAATTSGACCGPCRTTWRRAETAVP